MPHEAFKNKRLAVSYSLPPLTDDLAQAAEQIANPPAIQARKRRPASQVSDKQAEIIAWVLIYRRINATWPSYREIMDAFNLASTNSVHLHLAKITRAGFLQYKGARNFFADFDLIRSSGVLSRVSWLKILRLDDLLFVPPPLHLSPAILTQFPQLASALRNG